MVNVFGSQIPVLFDSGTIPAVMSVEMAKRLQVKPRPTKRSITVADGNEEVVEG